eukprot:3401121-Pyramimonas_sp.AAC.1
MVVQEVVGLVQERGQEVETQYDLLGPLGHPVHRQHRQDHAGLALPHVQLCNAHATQTHLVIVASTTKSSYYCTTPGSLRAVAGSYKV